MSTRPALGPLCVDLAHTRLLRGGNEVESRPRAFRARYADSVAEQAGELGNAFDVLEVANRLRDFRDPVFGQRRLWIKARYFVSMSLHSMPRGAEPLGASRVLVKRAPDLVTIVTVAPQGYS